MVNPPLKTLALKWQREYHLTIKGKNNGRPRISRSPKSDSEIPTSTKDWMRKRMMEVHLTQKTETHLPVKMAKLLNGTYVACRPMGGIRHARIGQKRDSQTANFSVCNTDKKICLLVPPHLESGGTIFFARSAHESRFVPIFKIAAPLLAGTI